MGTSSNIVRVGRVSSINVQNNTAKVVFDDKDDLVSDDLSILNRGSLANKDYWIPDIDEQVLCLFLPNPSGHGLNAGFVLGSFFSDVDQQQESSPDIRAIKFSDGSEVKHDRSTGDLTIKATGDITIIAAGNIKIEGVKVDINNN